MRTKRNTTSLNSISIEKDAMKTRETLIIIIVEAIGANQQFKRYFQLAELSMQFR